MKRIKLSWLLFFCVSFLFTGGCGKQNPGNQETLISFPDSQDSQSDAAMETETFSVQSEQSTPESVTDQTEQNPSSDTSQTEQDTSVTAQQSDSNPVHAEAVDRQAVLQNPGTLIPISSKVDTQSIAYLDMDGDGLSEEIILEPSREPENMVYYTEEEPLQYYHLQIGLGNKEGFSENLSDTFWAISLDGRNILLVLYEDGPSYDPYTSLYQYSQNHIIEAGSFADDIRECKISADGIITGTLRKDIVQTDWITMQWRLGKDGKIEEVPQEAYTFQNENWVELLVNLPLHTAIDSADTFTAAPQSVRFLQTSSDWNWILTETKDGQKGWMHVKDFEVTDLQQNVMEIFQGLNMAG